MFSSAMCWSKACTQCSAAEVNAMQRVSRSAYQMPRLLCFFLTFVDLYSTLHLFLFSGTFSTTWTHVPCKCLITKWYYLIKIPNKQFVGCEVILSQAHARLKRAVSIAFSMPSGAGGMESDGGNPFLLPALRGQDISPNLFAAKLNALLVLVLLESWRTRRMGWKFGGMADDVRYRCVWRISRVKKHQVAGLGVLL